uniref:Ancillary SecYEG translocon subunit n=1 Tax=Candidatus Aschnera chinzeii TaxID=1485666 RepID=A0AAT9G5A5_9ENTR|nr:MAG: YfgM family protein [Candidatus Aschnera chinzeii]
MKGQRVNNDSINHIAKKILKFKCITKYKIYIFGIIVLIGIIGYIIWHICSNIYMEKRIKNFEHIISRLDNNSKNAFANAEQFSNIANNIYGVIINIKLAKIAVEKNNIILAEKILINTLSMTKSDNIKNLINIRLARIQFYLNKLDMALNSLEKVTDKAWSGIVASIKGDIYLYKGNIDDARIAYTSAIELSNTGIIKEILKLKVNSLPPN